MTEVAIRGKQPVTFTSWQRLGSMVWLFIMCFSFGATAQPRSELPGQQPMVSYADTAQIAQTIAQVSKSNLSRKHPDSALKLVHTTLNSSKMLGYSYGIAASLYQLGIAYASQSLYSEATDLFREALSYCMNDGRSQRLLPLIYNNLGRLDHIRGDLHRAAIIYYHGIKLAENYFPDVDIGHVYSNLSVIFIHLGRPPDQIRYYLKTAEAFARKKQDHFVLGNVMVNTGICFNIVKQWDSSIHYFKKALIIGESHGYADVVYLAYSNMGTAWLAKNDPENALIYLERADSISRSERIDRAYQNSTNSALGQAYMQLNRHKEAEKVLLEAKNMSIRLQQPLNTREAHWSLGLLYAEMGEFEKAYTHTRAYIKLNDSISGDEIIRNVNHTEVKFRTDEKDQELMRNQLQFAQHERDLQRKNLWISTVISAALIILILSAWLYSRHRAKRRLLDEQLASLAHQQEIERLTAMMEGEENERNRIARELHDGIGGLIAAAQLNTAVLKNEDSQIASSEAYHKLRDILDDIGTEVRKTAHNLMPEILLHHDLPEAIRHFCKNMGQNRNLHIDVQAYGSFALLADKYRLSVYRIVQELMHNVVKHAGASHVLVQIIMQAPVLSITVEDNGQGFDTAQTSSHGAGLSNLRNRIQSLNGTFSLKSKPGAGTSVYIEISIPRKEHSTKKAILQR